jgi:thiamine-monophosphate kinase
VGAELQIASIPCSETALATGDPITHALKDGEDFELLFTVPADKESDFAGAWAEAHSVSCTRIGTVTASGQVEGVDRGGKRSALSATGYDHFSGN